MSLQQAMEVAVAHHQAGRLREAEALYRQILASDPNNAHAMHLLGVLGHQVGRSAEGAQLIQRAIAQDPQPDYFVNLGAVLLAMNRVDDAIEAYNQAIARQGDAAEAWGNLGGALVQKGRLQEAIAACRKALEINPKLGDAYNNLGNAHRMAGQTDAALEAYRNAVRAQDEDPHGHNNLGNLLREMGRGPEAIVELRRAIAIQPDFLEAHNNLAAALQETGDWAAAATEYRRALELRPDYVEAMVNYGTLLSQQSRIDQAIELFRRALALRPDSPEAHNGLGHALKDAGQLKDAIAAYRKAADVRPDPELAANLVSTILYDPSATREQIRAESARWNERFARPLAARIRAHDNTPDPDRRLRVGYISGDFRRQVVGYNMLPLFREHDHGLFEIYCYSNVPAEDAMTARFRCMADHWRPIRALSDQAAAELIRSDQIDVLVDLSVHTAHNRLLVLAQKPAPVQVTFAGYPGTTGLETVDYRLTDPYLDPPGQSDDMYSEQSYRLPHSFWCYEPESQHPQPGPLPAASNGFVTFGCLNAFQKVNEQVLELWAKVLRAVPTSRLMLQTRFGAHRQRTLQFLADRGVGPQRVELVDYAQKDEYLRRYQRIDIGLDTFPYNGHTTSLDSFWMGVPVVTRVADMAVGRAGWCQLSNLGLSELAAQDDEQFVQIASSLAGDVPRLAELRRTLRPRMEASALMDAKGFAREIEAAYRDMWKRWCCSRP
ncbi:MAG TPA: tetratricopeptide repeat protein [Tepidisphaeraceae bacterium]|nr:tetratricopeptide repeat protein [Tepidisphaeraceae bacterium]